MAQRQAAVEAEPMAQQQAVVEVTGKRAILASPGTTWESRETVGRLSRAWAT